MLKEPGVVVQAGRQTSTSKTFPWLVTTGVAKRNRSAHVPSPRRLQLAPGVSRRLGIDYFSTWSLFFPPKRIAMWCIRALQLAETSLGSFHPLRQLLHLYLHPGLRSAPERLAARTMASTSGWVSVLYDPMMMMTTENLDVATRCTLCHGSGILCGQKGAGT